MFYNYFVLVEVLNWQNKKQRLKVECDPCLGAEPSHHPSFGGSNGLDQPFCRVSPDAWHRGPLGIVFVDP